MKTKRVVSLLLLIAIASLFSFSQAAVGPFGDKPDSPRSLPADNLPPFRMLDAQGNLVPLPALPPEGLHHGPGAAPESTARGPSLALALDAAQAAIESCRTKGYRIGVSVIDSVGEARAMITADGADGSHVFVATRKALTALAIGNAERESRRSGDQRQNAARSHQTEHVCHGRSAADHRQCTDHRRHWRERRGRHALRTSGRTLRGCRFTQDSEQTQVVGETYGRLARRRLAQ